MKKLKSKIIFNCKEFYRGVILKKHTFWLKGFEEVLKITSEMKFIFV